MLRRAACFMHPRPIMALNTLGSDGAYDNGLSMAQNHIDRLIAARLPEDLRTLPRLVRLDPGAAAPIDPAKFQPDAKMLCDLQKLEHSQAQMAWTLHRGVVRPPEEAQVRLGAEPELPGCGPEPAVALEAFSKPDIST